MIDEPSRMPDPRQKKQLMEKVRRYAFVAGVLAALLAAWGVVERLHARSELRKYAEVA